MSIQYTAIFKQTPHGYIGIVAEMPGANCQGATLEQARDILKETLVNVVNGNRRMAEELIEGEHVIRETITVEA